MNIKRLFQPLVVTFVAAGAILAAAPVHAQDDPEPILTEEPTPTEEPAPAASFVSFCESVSLRNDGNVTIEFTIGSTPKGGGIDVPAHESRSAAIHFNVDGVPIRAYYNGDLFYEVFAKLTPPCVPTQWDAPTQTIVCGGEDVISVPEDTYEVKYHVHGGPGLQVVSAILTYDDRVLETWEFHESEEGCTPPTTEPEVAVGEPPVPPTTVPVTEPEAPIIRSLEVIGECQLYTIINDGNVRTSEYDGILLGVALNKNNEPPYMIYLEPGQSISFDLEVGDVVSLNLSEDWTVTSSTGTGSSVFTASSCEVVDVDLGDDIIRLYGTVDPTDPATMMLPETGFPNVKVSQLAVLIVMIGGLLVLVARRPATV